MFKLTKPCANCPFRNDEHFPLRRNRAQDIANTLLSDGHFHCHKTVDYSDPEDEDGEVIAAVAEAQHCAGALIILEKLERPNQLMRIGERIGFYDHTKLDMDAPVYDDFDSWVESMED